MANPLSFLFSLSALSDYKRPDCLFTQVNYGGGMCCWHFVSLYDVEAAVNTGVAAAADLSLMFDQPLSPSAESDYKRV